ncbi:MAG: hypothetical protein ACE5NL_01765 [Candidatus Hydrothermarchaeaceae archaeon]
MKKCRICGVPLSGYMYKQVVRERGIKRSKKKPDVCNKCEEA